MKRVMYKERKSKRERGREGEREKVETDERCGDR